MRVGIADICGTECQPCPVNKYLNLGSDACRALVVRELVHGKRLHAVIREDDAGRGVVECLGALYRHVHGYDGDGASCTVSCRVVGNQLQSPVAGCRKE